MRRCLRIYTIKHLLTLTFLCLLLILILPPLAQAQEPVVLTDQQNEYPLGLHLEILEDKEKTLTFENISSSEFDSLFIPSQTATPNYGFTNSAYWVRLRVNNKASATTQWLLELSFPDMNQIELYTPLPGQSGFDTRKTGNLLPLSTRDIPHHNFVFNLTFPPQTEQVIYLRFENEGAMSLPLSLWSSEAFIQKTYGELLKLGVFYGALLIMLGYSLFLFLTLRDKSYFYFFAFLFSFLLMALWIDGIPERFPRIHPGWWNRYALAFFTPLTFILALRFTNLFLMTDIHTPRLHKLILIVQVGLAGLIILIPFVPRAFISTSALIMALVSIVLILTAGIVAWKSGYQPARYFLLAWGGLLATASLTILSRLGWIPLNTFTLESSRIGIILMIMFLSSALADRINSIRQEREEAQAEVMRNQQEMLHLKDDFAKTLQQKNEELTRNIEERIHVEADLRKSESRYRAMVEDQTEFVVRSKPDETLLFVNNAYCRYFGVTRKEVLGKSYTRFLDPEDRKEVKDHLARLNPDNPLATNDERIIKPDGTTGWISWSSRGIFDEAGNLPEIQSVGRDITRRREAEEDVRNSRKRLEHQYQALMKLAKTKSMESEDLDIILSEISEVAAETLKVERVNIWLFNDGKSVMQCIENFDRIHTRHTSGGELAAADFPNYFAALSEERVIDASDASTDPRTQELAEPYLHPNGITSLLDAPIMLHGHMVGIICHEHIGPTRQWALDEQNFSGSMADLLSLALEMRERKRAEEALQQSQQRFQALIENALDIITILNSDGTVRYESPSIKRILGYEPDELIDQNVFDYIHPDDSPKVLNIFHQAVQDPSTLGAVEFRFKHRDGSWRVMEAVGRNLFDDPVVQGVVVNSRDITDRKNLEEQLLQAQKMEAIGQLAGGVAHDFNNILTVIIGNCDLILTELDDNSNQLRQDIEQISLAADRAASLTRQLLAFSRRQLLQLQVVNLNTLLTGVDKMLRRLIREDIELGIILSKDLGQILADPVQIEQVVVNLAVNARDAMPNGGKLTLETANIYVDDTYAAEHIEITPGSYVMLTITDTGTGMDSETQTQIFEPFFTTKEFGEGTGLGLATVYGIVNQSNGHIWVYSEKGIGTSFKIYFPRKDETVSSSIATNVEVDDLSGDETILLVEDDEQVRNIVRQVLQDHGYTLLETQEGNEALQVANNYSGIIHLLLTDVIMPGASGKTVADNLTKARPEIKVLFMSGYTDNVIAHHGVLDPGISLLQKPFNATTLAQKVREVLNM